MRPRLRTTPGVQVVSLGHTTTSARLTRQPGWRWSERIRLLCCLTQETRNEVGLGERLIYEEEWCNPTPMVNSSEMRSSEVFGCWKLVTRKESTAARF
jgi:hypothetical protein